VMSCEGLDRFTDRLLHFLSFLLDQVVAVVLTHLLVGRGRETDDGLRTGVAHINTDQHGALLLEGFWELEMVEITTSLGVHLSEDVGRFRKVELKTITSGDHLRWHSVLEHHFLKHLVVVLTLQNAHNHGGVLDLVITHHVASQLLIKLFSVVLLRQLNPMGLLNYKFELLGSFDEVFKDVVNDVVHTIRVLVHHNPLFF
jgi:hypothetical protein